MTIFTFADRINKELEIKRYPNQKNRFTCSFEYSETKRDKKNRVLTSTYGNGCSPKAAIKDYVKNISGNLLVFNAMSAERQEIVVPNNLSVPKSC